MLGGLKELKRVAVFEGTPFFLLNLEASKKKTVDQGGVPNASVITEKASRRESVAVDPGPRGLASRLPWHWQSYPSVRSQAALGRCQPRCRSRWWQRRGAQVMERSSRQLCSAGAGLSEHAQCAFQTNQSEEPLWVLA